MISRYADCFLTERFLSVDEMGYTVSMKHVSEDKWVFFEAMLADFFAKAGREHLPWRREGVTAYEVWVSEIMLQQTQVSRVMGYYTKFLERFPTVEAVAQTDWETFLPYYQGLGYYARGRNMLRAAQVVSERYGGVFPSSVEELDALPGIGPYTAAAIASFAYDRQQVAWDTNVRRVFGRFFFGTKHAQEIFALESRLTLPARMLNAALMDLGSALCGSRPKCAACPLASACRYRKESGTGEQLQVMRPESDMSRDWTQASVYIVLHEKHRQYFSENSLQYQPFRLPLGFTDRAGIKRWFLEHYGLSVSVRPPRKDVVRGVIWVNVQILTGICPFVAHTPQAFRMFLESVSRADDTVLGYGLLDRDVL